MAEEFIHCESRDSKTKHHKPYKNLVGQKFGTLTVESLFGFNKKWSLWNCKCDCGEVCVVCVTNIRRSKTCKRCLAKANSIQNRTHGLTETPTYQSWLSMKGRTTRRTSKFYSRYGGRGISVCHRWFTSFDAFIEDLGMCPDGLTLDRINNNSGYHCGKCDECSRNGWAMNARWATYTTQMRNKASNHVLDFNGQSHCIAEWSEITGIKRSTIGARLRYGWSTEKTLTTPVRRWN